MSAKLPPPGPTPAVPSGPIYPPPPANPFTLIKALHKHVVTTPRHVAWRFHSHDRARNCPFGPIFFSDRQKTRWDFTRGIKAKSECGTLCVGQTFDAAILEYFSKEWPGVLEQEQSPDPLTGQRALTDEQQTHVYATNLEIPDGLAMYDLTHPGAINAIGYGLDAWFTSTTEYVYTRPWSEWFFGCKDIDGLIYASRPGGAQLLNYVFFNRDPSLYSLPSPLSSRRS